MLSQWATEDILLMNLSEMCSVSTTATGLGAEINLGKANDLVLHKVRPDKHNSLKVYKSLGQIRGTCL